MSFISKNRTRRRRNREAMRETEKTMSTEQTKTMVREGVEYKYTKTGVIIDAEAAARIIGALAKNDSSKEAYRLCKEEAVENGLPDFELSQQKYYSLDNRMEIILVEAQEVKNG